MSGSLSDSSEELLQKGKGKQLIYIYDFDEGVPVIKHTSQ